MMRKTLVITLLLLSSLYINAQINVGINATLQLPTHSYKEVNSALGGSISIGYTFFDKLDVNFAAGNNWMNSFIPDYEIRLMELGADYLFLDKLVKPYIGFSGGYYIKNIGNVSPNPVIIEKGLGIKPRIGCLFEVSAVKGLAFNAQLYYNKIFTEHQVELFGIGIGLQYYFN